MKKQMVLTLALSLALTGLSSQTFASDRGHYKITITNLTRGTLFTPPLAVSHGRIAKVFKLGEAPSDELAQLAEGGNTQPIQDALFATGKAKDAANGGPVFPGQSVSMMVKADGARRISLFAMMVPTNDGFISLNGIKGPGKGGKKVIYIPAYDAGSEINDEHCGNIPGPQCAGEGYNAASGEGYVHIHAGIHGIGDLVAADYDWRNPVAKVLIENVR